MFIDPAINPRLALQRSAMFAATFRSSGARRISGSFRSINITSLRIFSLVGYLLSGCASIHSITGSRPGGHVSQEGSG